MNEQLDVDYWKAKKIWEDYQIPYLFLGYEPPSSYISRPLDDVITLDEQEEDLYVRYKSLIKDAIYSGELTPVASNLMGFSSLRAAEIKVWRKTVSIIEPVEIYLEMEDAITEGQKDAQDSSEVEQSSISISNWTELKIELHTKARMTIENLETGEKRAVLAASLDFANKRTGEWSKKWRILLHIAAGNIVTSKDKATIYWIKKSLKKLF